MLRAKCNRIIVVLVLLLYLAFSAEAQFSYSIQYTVNDGLPSSKIYDIHQDGKGYIWFATENGVSRFNGYTFTNFTTREGLASNSTLRLYEDYRGRIWFLSYQGTLSYYHEGEIEAYRHNDKLKDVSVPFIANIYVDEEETLWLSPFNGGLIKQDSTGDLSFVHEREPSEDSIYLYLEKREHGLIGFYFNFAKMAEAPDRKISNLSEASASYKLPIIKGEHHYNYVETPDHTYIAFGNKVFEVQGDSILARHYFGDEIIRLYRDASNNIWLSEKFHGVSMYKGSLDDGPQHHFFQDISVSSVLQDKEGNYWFTTTENGVFFVPSLNLRVFNEQNIDIQNEVIVSLEVNGDDVFFSTDHKEIYHALISGDQLMNVQSLGNDREFIDNIYAILSYSDDILYITGDYMPGLPDSILVYKKDRFDVHAVEFGYNLVKASDGTVILGQTNGIKIIRGNRILYRTPIDLFDVRVFAVAESDTGLLLGTISGLKIFKDGQYASLDSIDPVLGSRITTLHNTADRLWVGSFDDGLAVVSKDTVYHLDEANGLSSNRIKSMCIVNDTQAWIGTNRGLNRIDVKEGQYLQFDVRVLDIWDGLPSNEINEIRQQGNDIWLATDKGLVAFNPEILSYQPLPLTLVLDHVFLDTEQELDPGQVAELNHNENNLTFVYQAITYKNPRRTVYHYKLEGLNQNWNSTLNTSVRFHDLPPGKYTFFLRGTNADGGSSELVQYSFMIRKRFTQTAGFLVSMIALGGLLIFIVVRSILTVQQKRSQLQRQIYLAEQKAMLSQMNPHFIFNSLNSIQNFILENDHANANVYLVIFSSLIRKILEASKKNFISLKDEIDIIKLYLELEKFRFQDRFEYTITIDPGINPGSITLPSMILQPFLENAIWHGIMPKEGKGHLDLKVTRKDKGALKISITDNGIGRKKAEEITRKRKHHKPTGMKNVTERLKLLNELNNTNHSVEIRDLVDEQGTGNGTSVEIYLED
jgi:ligand-binding sensor domain-containing protein